GEVAAEAARALHAIGARILPPGAGGELAPLAAEADVHLADQALALGVAAGQGDAELALSAPALVDLAVARRGQARVRLELGGGGKGCQQCEQEGSGAAGNHAVGLCRMN